MSLFVVLLGAPGVGKGTQADLLSKELNLPHVSSGELFRDAIKSSTPLGIEAQAYLGRGELVPDALTIAMVGERLGRSDCANGAVLDGFPRTIQQARELDGILAESGAAVNLVPYIKAGTATLLQRLGGRWTCRNCQTVYHALYNPPRESGKCDACGGELYQRADDTPETHRRRIEVYLHQTAPLIEFYRKRCLLVEIDGEQDIQAVYAQLLTAVQGVAGQQRIEGVHCIECGE
jgi:adenylate kinase